MISALGGLDLVLRELSQIRRYLTRNPRPDQGDFATIQAVPAEEKLKCFIFLF